MRGPRITALACGGLIAIVTIGALAGYTWLFVRSMQRAGWTLTHLIDLLILWQAQTGVAFAIAAAFIGAAAVLYQTAAARQVEDDKRKRRAEALRATLPMPLSELADYATGCAESYAQLLGHPPDLPIIAPGLQFPSLPVGLSDRFTEMIEASEATHVRPLVLLIRQVQIHHARMQDTRARAEGRHGAILVRQNVITYIVDAAEIYARCDGLFLYARGEPNKAATRIHADDVRRALFLMLSRLSDTDDITEEINRRVAHEEDGRQWPEA